MGQPGMEELVGRVMIDPDFLADLLRAPEVVLDQYRLSQGERAAVLEALAKLGNTSGRQRVKAFQTALLKRWAV